MESIISDTCEDGCGGTNTLETERTERLLPGHSAAALADLFKALGDPTRIKMIHALLPGELCVHDLAVLLDMGQSAISHQLRYLRNLRIVKRRKAGKTVYYSVDDEHIEQILVQTLQHLGHE
ncbi:ArsR/SmtB family transcription factor [Paenibacillus sp. y28]|uniref:ArsR/SmtB family transcription factor n=1 Tax=Paenibacillus sp. y28 TaxID=3129110 RepID=UPI00301950BF